MLGDKQKYSALVTLETGGFGSNVKKEALTPAVRKVFPSDCKSSSFVGFFCLVGEKEQDSTFHPGWDSLFSRMCSKKQCMVLDSHL